MEDLIAKIKGLYDAFPLSCESLHLSYGTPGYRCKAELLNGIAARVGAYACIRSIQKGGLAVGIMISASHNPHQDNGLKLIDVDGGMLSPDLEPTVVKFVRSPCDEIDCFIYNFFNDDKIDLTVRPLVYLGWDSRVSSIVLSREIQRGVAALGGNTVDFGYTTTPQLHYLVHIQRPKYVPDSVTDYVDAFVQRFVRAFTSIRLPAGAPTEVGLNVDCAHGVGAIAFTSLASRLFLATQPSAAASAYPPDAPRLCLHTFNVLTADKELLNRDCGADFVKLYSERPKLTPMPDDPHIFAPSARWATVDGDADRLLYFFVPDAATSRSICLLDGDRIAALFTEFIAEQLKRHRHDLHNPAAFHLHVGVVQTAYANTASTRYLQKCLCELSKDADSASTLCSDRSDSVVCTLTGVKHLHKAAKQFDFGVYFEANGHGTVEISEKARAFVDSLPEDDPLRLFVDLVNTAVGDALTDLLLVEYVLAKKGRSLQAWFNLYHDLPSRQLKVVVKDRTVIKTTDADRRCSEPVGLQEAIDELVSRVDLLAVEAGSCAADSTRAFVRASGTEDMVRVYAEAATQPLADWLARAVAHLVHERVGGVGLAPEPLGEPPVQATD